MGTGALVVNKNFAMQYMYVPRSTTITTKTIRPPQGKIMQINSFINPVSYLNLKKKMDNELEEKVFPQESCTLWLRNFTQGFIRDSR